MLLLHSGRQGDQTVVRPDLNSAVPVNVPVTIKLVPARLPPWKQRHGNLCTQRRPRGTECMLVRRLDRCSTAWAPSSGECHCVQGVVENKSI